MSGSLGFSRGHFPVGYVTPSFPSLSFHLSQNPYEAPLLFKSWDIYVFTVYWFLIFSTGFHVCAVGIAWAANTNEQKRKKLSHISLMLLVYAVLGAFYGFVLGSFVGLLLASVYRAGALHMSTWIPFTWAFALMLFAVIVSYEHSTLDL